MSDQDNKPQADTKSQDTDKDMLTKCTESFWNGVAHLMEKISTHEEFQKTHNIFHSDSYGSGHGLPPKVADIAKVASDKKVGHTK